MRNPAQMPAAAGLRPDPPPAPMPTLGAVLDAIVDVQRRRARRWLAAVLVWAVAMTATVLALGVCTWWP
jgi:hypothetical protein